MITTVFPWIMSFVGIIGFYLAGKKIWWAWYVNLANQAIWLTYSIVTQQWGFLLATLFYIFVFSKNARDWTREHNNPKKSWSHKAKPIAYIPPDGIQETDYGVAFVGDSSDWNRKTCLGGSLVHPECVHPFKGQHPPHQFFSALRTSLIIPRDQQTTATGFSQCWARHPLSNKQCVKAWPHIKSQFESDQWHGAPGSSWI